MATLKKYNLDGKELGEVNVDEALVEATANGQMVKDYIVAIRENARQWSANTRGRSEVNHSNHKPHAQKGTGKARQGSLAAPQYKGGGCVFGPKPKFDQHVRINKKERRSAIRAILAEKIRDNSVIVLEDFSMEAPKTKTAKNFLNAVGFTKRTLFVGESNYAESEPGKRINVSSDAHTNLRRSLNNIPKIAFNLAKLVSGYDVMVAQKLVMTEAALKELQDWLK